MAHFDRDGLLDPHVRDTLASLSGPGNELILVSANLSGTEELASTGISQVVRRENRGYDFRSWQVGLRALGDLRRFDEVVLLNDSFYPAHGDALARALAAMERRSLDVWALTASRERGAHLQSFFQAFRPAALRSAWFRRFWDAVAPDGTRAEVIETYELPLAAQARAAGLRVGTLRHARWLPRPQVLAECWSTHSKAAGRRNAFWAVMEEIRRGDVANPTLQDWRETCRRCGIVKVELLRDNPASADLSPLPTLMDPAHLARALGHLRRVAPGAAYLRLPAPG